MGVRELLFSLVALDAELGLLGISVDNTYANGAPDSPAGTLWVILRWGIEAPGAGGQRGRMSVTDREVGLWAYDRNADYGTINAILRRWHEIMDTLESRSTGDAATDGWVSSCIWSADADDSFDDGYAAYVRGSTYRIIASGD